ncbi:ankyrin repeat-containing domain protein, partial [Geopyxis carbonaria]
MPLLALPPELLLLITDYLDPPSHSAFLRTTRPLASLLTSALYRSALRADSGLAALTYAAIHNSPIIAYTFLCVYNVSPDLRGVEDQTLLHIAAANDAVEVLDMLLDFKACPCAVTDAGLAPLHLATTPRIAMALLKRGASPMCRDELEQTPLHAAAKAGHAGVIEALLSAGATVDAICKDPQNEIDDGYTPLHGAADFGHADAARLLIKAGATIDAKIEQSEWTPLGCAAAEGYHEVVRLLLEAGAEVNIAPEVPLRLAVDGKWCDAVLRMLLDGGASVDRAVEGLLHMDTAERLQEFAQSWREGKGKEEADVVMTET